MKMENYKISGMLWGLALAASAMLTACGSDSSSGAVNGGGESSSSVECTNTYGTNTVTDCRDNQVYRTVVIGTQTWMAENLNYATHSSWCYGNSADSCSKYGRLYQWAAAMGVSASYNDAILGDSVNLQGACPSGWHVPSSVEWTTLETAVGGSSTAGTALKSTSGWYNDGNGTDSYGFSVLPAGSRYSDGNFYSAGDAAYFWSATENDADGAYERNLDYGHADVGTYGNYKFYAFSVRCLKDL